MKKEAQPPDWNQGLDKIEPLVEFYVREMGQLAGRLMAALSLLADLENSYGWDRSSIQAQDTLRYSRLLVATVLKIVAAAQLELADETGLAQAIQAQLQRLSSPRD